MNLAEAIDKYIILEEDAERKATEATEAGRRRLEANHEIAEALATAGFAPEQTIACGNRIVTMVRGGHPAQIAIRVTVNRRNRFAEDITLKNLQLPEPTK